MEWVWSIANQKCQVLQTGRLLSCRESPARCFNVVQNQVVKLHAEWGGYQQLFGDENDWELLVQYSRFAWPILHDALVERCVLLIARLTDKPFSSGSKDKPNLSIAQLIRILRGEGHGGLCDQLDVSLKQIREESEPLVSLRHKVLAHSDLHVTRGEREYPKVSVQLIGSLIPRIAGICQTVRTHFDAGHFHYDWCVGAWAKGIIQSLQRLQQYEELRDRIRRGEPLDVYDLRQALLTVGRKQP